LEMFDTDSNYIYVGGEFGVAIYQHVTGGTGTPIQGAEYLDESKYILNNVTTNPKYFVLGISADYFDRPDNDDVNANTGKMKWEGSAGEIFNYSYRMVVNGQPDFDRDVGICDNCNITIRIGKTDADYYVLFH